MLRQTMAWHVGLLCLGAPLSVDNHVEDFTNAQSPDLTVDGDFLVNEISPGMGRCGLGQVDFGVEGKSASA